MPQQLRVLSIIVSLFLFSLTQAHAQLKDITQPTDPIVASSANNPSSEGVGNVIDNGPAKYLNFDADQRLGSLPTGFAVSPSVGVTRVLGMTIQSANDGPERDPKTVTLEGSNDATVTGFATGNWTPITTIDVPVFTSRFQTQTFVFPNLQAYRHYRWTVTAVQTPNDCLVPQNI